ncbi:hypothetical protein PENANT_c010G05883 [Penicillium antarcticum]|uniref:Transcription factor domain-containing protein n=2 Tax=Penicillium antarcticum TaxID=416450 RepID=A0A1V6Q9K7_9EURO|nr:hypothetical protein PENANT_c010G05883 [Penicillium antarcticum]
MLAQGETAPQIPVSSAIWTSDGVISYQLNAKCQDLITRCFERSLITADDPNTIYVNSKLLRLAFTYPYLMHACLAVAFTYDRHLNRSGVRRSLDECYQWSQSTILFNKRLRDPIEPEDKDPIWATATAMTILIFSSPDPCTPGESWPLKNSDQSDLNWLHMSKGKMLLWQTVNPLRPDSLFSVMTTAFAQINTPFPERGMDGIPTALAAICYLEDSSTAGNNPYFYAAHAVSQILDLSHGEVTTAQTQVFMLNIHGPFENLLWHKDPAALLLL